jgi:hypothetical protein
MITQTMQRDDTAASRLSGSKQDHYGVAAPPGDSVAVAAVTLATWMLTQQVDAQ